MGNSAAAKNDDTLIYNVRGPNQKMEMIVNSSRIITLEHPIQEVFSNNDQIIQAKGLSANEVQLFAVTPGITQVNLRDADKKIYTIDVQVIGDTRELAQLLQQEFPTSSLKLRTIATGVLISGFVEDPEEIMQIRTISEEFYPRVLLNVEVSGINQVLLHVKIVEVSRTKLARCGFDWWQVDPTGGQVAANGAGGVGAIDIQESLITMNTNTTLGFQAVNNASSFFGVLEALRQDNLAKVWSEPSLVTYNGRPATFLAGGEVPIQSGGGLGVPTNTHTNSSEPRSSSFRSYLVTAE